MAKESFLRGAFILAGSSTACRLVGLIYITVLPRVLGDTGMGLLQLVKPIHYFVAVIAIFGFPAATSKLVAEYAASQSQQGVVAVLKLTFLTMLASGGLAAVILIGIADLLALQVAKDIGVYYAIICLAPAVFFLSVGSCLRGFFQGLQCMTPPAAAQLADQLVKVGGATLLSLWLLPRGVEYAVAGAVLGGALGEAAGFAVLSFYYVAQGRQFIADLPLAESVPHVRILWYRLFALAFPFVAATILWPVMQMLDTLIIPIRLREAGLMAAEIRAGMGHLGMALNLASFPNVVTVSLAVSLIPAISQAWVAGSQTMVRNRVETALRMALLFGVPACIGLYTLADPVATLLFGYLEVSAPLRILAVGTLVLGIVQSGAGIFQGMGQMFRPVKYLAVGLAVKFLVSYVLLGLPGVGILGAAWGTTAGWSATAILTLIALLRQVPCRLDYWQVVLGPAITGLAMGMVVHYLYAVAEATAVALTGASLVVQPLLHVIVVALSIGWGGSVYFLALMVFGCIRSADILAIPRVGLPFSEWLRSYGFLRR